MKYTNRLKTYALCIGLALSVVSCSNDDFEGTNTTDDQLVDMTFVSAGLESPSNAEDITPSNQAKTRTVLGSDGTTVTWQANDKMVLALKDTNPRTILSPLLPLEVTYISGEQHQMSTM